jgi:WD40 repeat protein
MLESLNLVNACEMMAKKAKPKPKRKSRQEGGELSSERRRSSRISTVESTLSPQPDDDDAPLIRASVSRFLGPSLGVSLVGGSGNWGSRSHEDLLDEDYGLYEGHSHNTYSLSVAGCYLAAAGEKSMATFFKLQPPRIEEASGKLATVKPSCRVSEPVLSVRLHSRWIGAIQFLSSNNNPNSLSVLTVSDDCSVVLSKFTAEKEGPASLVPMARLTTLHSGGIFKMHERGLQILSASKDYTVGLSQVTDSGLAVVRNYDICQNVVKTVRWRATDTSPVIFAAAGNDCDLHVMDVRTHKASSVVDAHTQAINTVLWHSNKEELLMTYGFDRYTHLYDVRQNKQPVLVFKAPGEGSRRPNLCGNIFSDDGTMIFSPGEHNMLHKISVATGALISSKCIGFTPTSLLLDDRDKSLLAAEGRAIWSIPKSSYLPK